MPQETTQSKIAILSIKVMVKAKSLLTLVSFERALLLEYACQLWTQVSTSISYNSKYMAKV